MARGRKPSVRYWDSRGGYCCWIDGQRELLAKGADDAPSGPVYLEALERFRNEELPRVMVMRQHEQVAQHVLERAAG